MFKKLQLLILSALLCLNCFSQVRNYKVTAYDSASKGYYFLSCIKLGISSETQDHLILDSKGNVVYYKPFIKSGPTYDFRIQPNGQMSFFYNNKFFLMDSTFHIVDSVQCGNGVLTDEHEFQVLSNGHFLLLGYEYVFKDLSSYHLFNKNGSAGSTNAKVKAGIVQELDENKNVVFEWHSIDFLPFDGVDAFWISSPSNVDWTHMNAIDLDNDGNLLVSIRHFNEIVKINRTDSSIIWRFGGKYNQFTMTGDTTRFYGQHDIRRLQNGNITLFDNANYYKYHGARGVEYKLDEVNKTARLVWSHTYDSTMFSQATGSVQRLPNGNTLVDYGFINKNIVCFDVTDPNGKKIFQVDFPDRLLSYRAHNYFSLPWSLDRPQVREIDSNGVIYLEASEGRNSYVWSNGDTGSLIKVKASGNYYVDVPYGIGFIRSEIKSIHLISGVGITAVISPSAIVCPGPQSIIVVIKNKGLDTLHTVVIKCSINGISQPDFKFKGALPYDSLKNITIGSFDFRSGNNIIETYATLANNQPDTFKNDTTLYTFKVNDLPAAKVGLPQMVCWGSSTTIGSSVTVANHRYEWTSTPQGFVSNSPNPVIRPLLNTVYKLTETDTILGCKNSDSVFITVVPLPQHTTISGPATVCGGTQAWYGPFTKSNDASYSYSVDANNPNIITQIGDSLLVTWTKTGNYTIWMKFSNSTGCVDSSSLEVTVSGKPTADYTTSDVCLGKLATFSNASQNNVSNLWNFGDGITSTIENPTHLFLNAGTYKVTLAISNPAGCVDFIMHEVNVDSLPVASFTIPSESICLGESIKINNTSEAAKIVAWDFGDGVTSSDLNPAPHVYSLAGTYMVSLYVQNDGGCLDSMVRTVTVHPLPVPTFRFQEKNAGEFSFVVDDTSAATYEWNFGDGNTALGKSVSHIFLTENTYYVTLFVSGKAGCTDSSAQSITYKASNIFEISYKYRISLYPNPFTYYLSLNLSLSQKSEVIVSIADITGKQSNMLYTGTLPSGEKKLTFDNDRLHLKPGVYLLNVSINGKPYTYRVVKIDE